MSNVEQTAEFSGWFDLFANAELSLGIAHGTGLGAFLLAVIAISFILSRPFKASRLSDLVSAWRDQKKELPPAE